MSDALNLVEILKFKSRVNLSFDHCLSYVRRDCISADKIALTVYVSYEWLKNLDEAKQSGVLQQTGYGCIDVLNLHLAEKLHTVQIKKDCSRIEGRLRRACSEIVNKFRGKNGSAYRKLEQKEIKIAVRADEIISIAELERELKIEKDKSRQLTLNNEILQNRCEELYSQMLELEAKNREADKLQVKNTAEINKLLTKNSQLQSYIDSIGQDIEFENRSGKVNEVCDRQQRRKLKELKTHVEQALWFAETFALKLQTVSFADEKASIYSMNYLAEGGKKSYQDLPEEEKQKVQSVLLF